jgi:hypothetical protein
MPRILVRCIIKKLITLKGYSHEKSHHREIYEKFLEHAVLLNWGCSALQCAEIVKRIN